MPALNRISKARALASQRAYNYLRDGIFSGQLKTGQTITEDEVASAVGVSRTPVREAIRRASADGLLDLEDFRRARVAQSGDEEIDDTLELLATLEALAAQRAAARITPAEIEQLENLATAMEVTTQSGGDMQLRRFNDLNTEFHMVILRASRSRQIVLATERLVETPTVLLRRYESNLIGNLERTNGHHRGIITALKARDPKWAHAEMTVHLISARTNLL